MCVSGKNPEFIFHNFWLRLQCIIIEKLSTVLCYSRDGVYLAQRVGRTILKSISSSIDRRLWIVFVKFLQNITFSVNDPHIISYWEQGLIILKVSIIAFLSSKQLCTWCVYNVPGYPGVEKKKIETRIKLIYNILVWLILPHLSSKCLHVVFMKFCWKGFFFKIMHTFWMFRPI